MPSPAESSRARLELVLRIAAIALIAWSLWLATQPLIDHAETAAVRSAELEERVREWASTGAPESLHVTIDSIPDETTRDWLIALRRSGSDIAWSGDVAALAIAVEPVNAPSGGAQVLVAAPTDTIMAVRDAAGPLDSVRAGSGGLALRVRMLAEPARVRVGSTSARANATDSLSPGRVLVLGTAGWEARYAIAALEESGWTVDARLTIGPGDAVRRGSPGSIDTSRYVAVIAFDSAAASDGRRIAAFARNGGGVILSGVAASTSGVRDIAPARPGARVRPAMMTFTASEPRRALGFVALTRIRDDALVLERRGDQPVIAARREGLGRVMQIGYDESWRWRMQGGDTGPEAHRRWWSDVVAATARERVIRRPSSGGDVGLAAPRAVLTAAFGPPSSVPASGEQAPERHGPHPWLLVAGAALLLAEWSSRRLRGAA